MSISNHEAGFAIVASIILALGRMAIADEPAGGPPVDNPEEESDAPTDHVEVPDVPPAKRPVIQAAPLPPQPAPGKGRLNLVVDGDRTWCTYRDDRVIQPPPGVGLESSRRRVYDPIYTYGYQFTIAAVARDRPSETILLFESPVIRTAYLRLAAKLGRGGKKPPGPTTIQSEANKKKRAGLVFDDPDSIVPFWEELFACTQLPESFDFDLGPGAYDVSMAFDVLSRSGRWAHRSIGFLTDVVVQEGRRTRLEGRVDQGGGGRRDVDLLRFALQPATDAGAGATP